MKFTCMKIRSMRAGLFRAGVRMDGQTDKQDEFNSRVPQFCETRLKRAVLIILLLD